MKFGATWILRVEFAAWPSETGPFAAGEAGDGSTACGAELPPPEHAATTTAVDESAAKV
jgi:hypothetical protein